MHHFIRPQSRQRVSSEISVTSNITINKKRKIMKKMRKKQRRSIQRLYNTIRASSSTSMDCQVQEPKQNSPKLKRKNIEINNSPNAKRKPTDDGIIIIRDEETPKKTNSTTSLPHSSTPYNNHTRNLTDLNISNVTVDGTINNTEAVNLTNQIQDLTKEINKSSYLTIDLTTNTTCTEPTVIDLVNATETPDCTIVVPEINHSDTSCNSDVTVIENTSKGNSRRKKLQENKMKEFAEGISKMNASEKGKLLEMITAKIFNGCSMQKHGIGGSNSSLSINSKNSRPADTAEDAFIKEVILGQSTSRNSVGSNIYNPERDIRAKSGLRMVVIDGSNVAMEHGQHKSFSVKGLKICLDYFLKRGHIVKAFVPRFRCKFGKSTDPRLLDELERRGLVVYTPSREVQGRMITPYDDRYIVQTAAEFDGVIVSGDNYRDLMGENPKWRHCIERRLLPFTWVNDMIMFPKDPLGRNGPTLEEFLRYEPRPQGNNK